MTPKTIFALAASSTLLAISMPLAAQDTTTPAGDTTMQNPAPVPPEAPATPAPTEVPAPPAPPSAPAPATPPPATAEDSSTDTMSTGTTTSTTQPMQTMEPMQPGTMPGAQNTNMTNPPPAPQASYPRCSRTITDQCQQSSAREADYKGGPPARRPRRR